MYHIFNQRKHAIQKERLCQFIGWRFLFKYRVRMRRHGSYYDKLLSYPRDTFTFVAPSMINLAQQSAKKILLLFLKKKDMNERFMGKLELFYRKITSMQRKIFNLKVRRDSKFRMLKQLWDKTLEWLT